MCLTKHSLLEKFQTLPRRCGSYFTIWVTNPTLYNKGLLFAEMGYGN